jgi:hypothetical protein
VRVLDSIPRHHDEKAREPNARLIVLAILFGAFLPTHVLSTRAQTRPIDVAEFAEDVEVHRIVFKQSGKFLEPVRNVEVKPPDGLAGVLRMGRVTLAKPAEGAQIELGATPHGSPAAHLRLSSGTVLTFTEVEDWKWRIALTAGETMAMLGRGLSDEARRALIDERFRTDLELAEYMGSLTIDGLTGQRTPEQILRLNAMLHASPNSWQVRADVLAGIAFVGVRATKLEGQPTIRAVAELYGPDGRHVAMFTAFAVADPDRDEAPAPEVDEVLSVMLYFLASIKEIGELERGDD